jgi:RNA polymerase sigma-B factor
LIKAVGAFDAGRGTAFSFYAVPCIVGALKRHYHDVGWSVRPPRELQELALHVNQLNEELSRSGVPPTAAQIADYAGVTVEAVLEAREAYRALHSDALDQPRRTGDLITPSAA